MDKFAEALVELVRSGAPLASYAITMYYLTEILNSVLVAASVCTVAGLAFVLIRHGQRIIERKMEKVKE